MAPAVNWQTVASAVAHRPWPMPQRRWSMTMSWIDLLFAHWRVDVDLLQKALPAGLEVDTFEGEAWLGVVPFRMANVGPRGLSNLPWISRFAELNVRTYAVARDGRPGVWFFSLDAQNPLAVAGARVAFHLPYFAARMRCEHRSDWVEYESRRRHPGAPAAEFAGRYRPVGDTYAAAAGTLEHWLTERYCLYSAGRGGRLFRGEIQHRPWPLQRAEAEIEINTMADSHGFALREPPALLHFAAQIDVVCWTLDRPSSIQPS